MKIIFLDIDGVLNSLRSAYAFNGFPTTFNKIDMERFDQVALNLIRKLAKETSSRIIISSSWRYTFKPEEIGAGLSLPVIGATPRSNDCRGAEIDAWIKGFDATYSNQKLASFVIIDDDNDMLDHQRKNFVRVDNTEGFQLSNYLQALKILGGSDEEIRALALSLDTPL